MPKSKENSKRNQTTLANFSNRSSIFDALKLLDEIEEHITDNENLSLEVRISILRKMSIALFAQSKKIVPEPTPAKIKFRERVNRNQTGIEFIKEHFGDCLGISLTPAHIKKLDATLYDNIVNFKKKNGGTWPADFPMLSQSEITNKILELYTLEELEELEKLGANIRSRRQKGLLGVDDY